LLLGEMSLFAVLTNFVAKYAAVLRFRRHSCITRARSVVILHTV
jgi:hypothetical protein